VDRTELWCLQNSVAKCGDLLQKAPAVALGAESVEVKAWSDALWVVIIQPHRGCAWKTPRCCRKLLFVGVENHGP